MEKVGARRLRERFREQLVDGHVASPFTIGANELPNPLCVPAIVRW
jgi:hypothetical protein